MKNCDVHQAANSSRAEARRSEEAAKKAYENVVKEMIASIEAKFKGTSRKSEATEHR